MPRASDDDQLDRWADEDTAGALDEVLAELDALLSTDLSDDHSAAIRAAADLLEQVSTELNPH